MHRFAQTNSRPTSPGGSSAPELAPRARSTPYPFKQWLDPAELARVMDDRPDLYQTRIKPRRYRLDWDRALMWAGLLIFGALAAHVWMSGHLLGDF